MEDDSYFLGEHFIRLYWLDVTFVSLLGETWTWNSPQKSHECALKLPDL